MAGRMNRGEPTRVPYDLWTADALAHWHACHCDCSLEGMTEAGSQGVVVAHRRRGRTCADPRRTYPHACVLDDDRRVRREDCHMGAFLRLQATARHGTSVGHTSALALLPTPGARSALSQMEHRSPSLEVALQAESVKRAPEAVEIEASHGYERLAWLVQSEGRGERFPFAPDRPRNRSRRGRADREERYDCRGLLAPVPPFWPSVFQRRLVLDLFSRHVLLPPPAQAPQ